MFRVVLALVGVIAGAAFARDAHAEKIAIVDTQKIISESIIGKAAKNNLEAQIKKEQAKLAAIKADFDKQKAELEKQAAILSGSALATRRESLGKKQVELQRAFQEVQEKLAKLNEAELAKVVEQIGDVVEELADDRGYSFVFERDRQSVLFASEKIDITEEVVKILDKKKVSL